MHAPARTLTLMLAATLAAGCGGDATGGRESGMADSTRFGDDRARQGSAARTLPDVALLEGLVDAYEQLDVVMDELAGPAGGSPVRGRAWSGNRHEDAAKARLLDLLQTEFGERYHPRSPEGAARRTDAIASLPHDAGTRALDALVLDHHRRARRAIGDAMDALRNPRVREELHQLHRHLGEEIERLGRRQSPG